MSAPNILLCGTPGTGKSTLGEELAALLPDMRFVSVSELAKERHLHDGEYDAERDTLVIDEDKVVRRPMVCQSGVAARPLHTASQWLACR